MILVAILMALQEPEVVIEGTRDLGEGDLRRIIKPDIERYAASPRQTVLDDAAFRLASHYRNLGYHFVKVRAEEAGGKIVIHVEEGAQVSLGRLHIEGNVAISTDALKALVPGLPGGGAAYSPRVMSLYIRTIVEAYHRLGYIDVSVAEAEASYEEERHRMHLTLLITEGRQYRVVGIRGAPPGFGAELMGKPYTPDGRAQVEGDLIDAMRESGHPLAAARASPLIDREKAEVVIQVEMNEGPSAVIGDVQVAGLQNTRESFVVGRSDLGIGGMYRASDLRRAEDRLRETGLFRSVVVSHGEVQEGRVGVEIRVEERKPGEASLRLGYGTLDGPRVGADGAYANIFGGGETVRVGGTFSRFTLRSEVDMSVPYLFQTDLLAATAMHYERMTFPSFDADSYGVFPTLSLPVYRGLRVTGGVRFAFVRTLKIRSGVPPGDRLDFSYRALSLATSWDRRDDPVLPTRGFMVSGVVEWSGRPFSSTVQFLKADGVASFLFPLPADLVFAISLHGGVIIPTQDTETMPVALRFFAGGTNTVRGFKFGTLGPEAGGKPTGGEAFAAVQTEVRFPIYGILNGAVFADRGNVWFERREFSLSDMRYSVGAGLRVHTLAGALVADVAWNVNRRNGEAPVELHLSIGFPF